MPRSIPSFAVISLLACALPCGGVSRAAEAPLSFQRDVRPILSDKCFACHGPDPHTREAGLRLDTAEGALADLGGYAAVVPGDPEASELVARITTDDSIDLMPPPEAHKPLSPAEVDTLIRWVAEGAGYEPHWAYQPVGRPEAPGTPEAEAGAAGGIRNEIDRFLLPEMLARGLEPSPEADRATLARRLHLDLTGLPPSPERVAAFLADDSPRAYEDLVEELLRSPRFGERMALFWLDLVRYADTIGYHSDNHMEVSAYRDWVIGAFNANLPYDRFTIEQIAGDLLPEGTLEQRVASGYNRLLQTTEEGGAQAQEYAAIYAADRVRNVSEAWLASTMGCAQCHDHKYDPFTMRDFYRMAAFFSDIKENAVGKRQPNLKLPTPEEEAELALLRENLAEKTLPKLLAGDPALAARVSAARAAWEEEARASLEEEGWQVAAPAAMVSAGGQELKELPDGSALAGGSRNPDQDDYTVTLRAAGRITALRLEALLHDSLAQGRLSRGNGNFVLTGFAVAAGGDALAIAEAAASHEQAGFPLAHALDGDPATGWGGDAYREGAADRVAVFHLAEPLDLGEGGELTVTLSHQSPHAKHAIGRFRLSVSSAPAPGLSGGLDLPLALQEALRLPAGERAAEQAAALAEHYLSLAPDLQEHRDNLAAWQARLEEVEKGIRTMLVAEAMDEPRVTRVLDRGNWQDESGEIVEPGVPAFLARGEPEGRRATRLDLARWIMDGDNPLTARAFANRAWKLFFGAGLSRDALDLGGQGHPPAHPALLDWLAAEFRDSGWDVKRLVSLMVNSGAYRRSSVPAPGAREADPGNEWLARQGRWRLEAELVRDAALEISGLLVNEAGGLSAKPYQPARYWQHLNFPRREWEADAGEGLYRRGLYTFWCRTFLHPAMLAFDAPSREECVAERPRSNTPQQALVLLNDPSFVEASRVFAAAILRQPADDSGKLEWAWTKATGRTPETEESDILAALLQRQQERYAADAAAAGELLSTGTAPLPGNLDPAELAAWTQVARAILNAHETTSRH